MFRIFNLWLWSLSQIDNYLRLIEFMSDKNQFEIKKIKKQNDHIWSSRQSNNERFSFFFLFCYKNVKSINPLHQISLRHFMLMKRICTYNENKTINSSHDAVSNDHRSN